MPRRRAAESLLISAGWNRTGTTTGQLIHKCG